LDIDEVALSGGLTEQDQQKINAVLSFWAQRIVEADDPKDIIAARKSLVSGYGRYPTSTYFQYAYAGQAAKILTPILTEAGKPDDNLWSLKQVNLAIALSRMSQETIQPALEAMVVHDNPAVRYLGWMGYQAVRTFILSQTPEYAQRMFASLTHAAVEEKEAPVLAAIFSVCNITPIAGASATVSEQVLANARQQAFAVLRTNVRRWCLRVMRSELEVTKAFAKAVIAIQTLSSAMDDEEVKTQALQMLVDVVYCAAKAFDDAQGQGEISKENAALLKRTEVALIALSGKRANHISGPLNEDDLPDQGAAVRDGVFQWIEDLQEFNVAKPEFAPTTQPVSLPAATPTNSR